MGRSGGLLLGISFALACLHPAAAADDPIPPEKLPVLVEALARLQPEQVRSNPQLAAALERVLKATRGTADFVRLVKVLQLTDQSEGLLEVLRAGGTQETCVEVVKALLAAKPAGFLAEWCSREPVPVAQRVVDALGNSLDRRSVPALSGIVKDPARDASLRRSAVRSLTRTQEGAQALLSLARAHALAEDLTFVASTELTSVRWADIKADAAKVFPAQQSAGGLALPPVAELTKRNGHASAGAAVFRRDTVGCIRCHQVNGEGIDFGPKLSEIGSKLGKDALYEAILDPSSGISFGFEAWLVQLKDGDEVYGLKVSETEDELAIKAPGGVVTRHKKAEVARQEQMKTSLMPAGLAAAMTTEELVDLVEYLTTLRTPGK